MPTIGDMRNPLNRQAGVPDANTPAPSKPAGLIAPAGRPKWPNIPEEIMITREAWATYSPALKNAMLQLKLPDLSPDGIAVVIGKFDVCGYPPVPPQLPGDPGLPPGPGYPPGPEQAPPFPSNPPFNPGEPDAQQPAGKPYYQYGHPMQPNYLPAQWVMGPHASYPHMYPAPSPYPHPAYVPGLYAPFQLPAGQAQPGGPKMPGTLGSVVLGGSLVAAAWMLWEVTRKKPRSAR